MKLSHFVVISLLSTLAARANAQSERNGVSLEGAEFARAESQGAADDEWGQQRAGGSAIKKPAAVPVPVVTPAPAPQPVAAPTASDDDDDFDETKEPEVKAAVPVAVPVPTPAAGPAIAPAAPAAPAPAVKRVQPQAVRKIAPPTPALAPDTNRDVPDTKDLNAPATDKSLGNQPVKAAAAAPAPTPIATPIKESAAPPVTDEIKAKPHPSKVNPADVGLSPEQTSAIIEIRKKAQSEVEKRLGEELKAAKLDMNAAMVDATPADEVRKKFDLVQKKYLELQRIKFEKTLKIREVLSVEQRKKLQGFKSSH